MPLPLIPVAIALVVSGLGGASAGVKGAKGVSAAKSIQSKAKERNESDVAKHKRAQDLTNTHLSTYGIRQIEIQATTLSDWVTWLEANERKVKRLHRKVVGGVEVAEFDLPELRKLVKEAQLLQGGVGAVASAIVAQQAALAGVTYLAAAGTGAGIATLSGAAAESATLAWLGGGTLAAGGGGVAAGGLVLTGIAVAPALLVGGITLAIQGDKALTQARNYEADVDKAHAEIDLTIGLLQRLRRRSDELLNILNRLDPLAEESLQSLARLNFDPDRDPDLQLFQQTAILMAELGQILSAPLLDEDGDISREIITIIERYEV